MPDQPYTDDDLRTEAACQHAELTTNPDFMGVSEGMDDDLVVSTEPTGGRTWSELLPDPDKYNAAQRQIHDLIAGAADISDWAVNLGADGLVPDEHQLGFNAGGRPIVRIHFAFAPGLPNGIRDGLVVGIGEAVAAEMGVDLQE
ncbi:hypothetical protein IPZ58_07765 [Streptomyces roseoverticillatus]|uniref:hypothetical protein n=1 Tax=Streptomyces roseoverticillatus TaxID=66429 RepID=UPI001F36454C|nr:hypothetical protein [Streptomyces roseoverticillatus]MCF3101475.1 hypothetical protein [Streptomyces roseoverticillatus]